MTEKVNDSVHSPVLEHREELRPGQLKQSLGRPPIGPDMFIAQQLLGNGSFGEVYLVQRKTDKKQFAMKVLSKAKIKQ